MKPQRPNRLAATQQDSFRLAVGSYASFRRTNHFSSSTPQKTAVLNSRQMASSRGGSAVVLKNVCRKGT